MNEYLYHYTTIEKFLDGISKSNSIRLSPILEVNDPLDYKERTFRNKQLFESGEGIKSIPLREEYKKTLNEKWISNCKIACFSTSNIHEEIEGFQLANLWSYYAGNHTGVCLKLYKDKIDSYFEENFKCYHPLKDSVEYRNKLSHFNYNTNYNKNEFKGIEENKSALFFEKLKVWDREQEYRLVCFSTNDYEYIPLEGVLSEIILGQKIIQRHELEIKNRFPLINIHKMNYFVGDGKFEKLELDHKFWKENAKVE